MRTALVICSIALVMLLLGGLSQAFAAEAGGQANGVYAVQVLSGGAWKTVGTASFGLHYTTRTVSLPGDHDLVRLVQSGGTAAQLDSVSLDGLAPSAVSGSADLLALKKVLATDNDVTNAYGDAVVLTFPSGGSTLQIDARIQGDISGAFPFEYPAANSYKPVDLASSFYSYRVGDVPTAIDTAGTPFIRVFSAPGTGHPMGYTYAWVADDAKYLLVTIDFTPDNTMDGDEDYAKVHVKTTDGVKDFKVSVAERTWGVAAFTYTDKVSYQHKLYTFKIPWSAIGTRSGAVGLSFTAYGTSAIIPLPVYRFYNMKNGSHFYTASEAERASVVANLSSVYGFEGTAYTINESNPVNNAPLYRFYDPKKGVHFYTCSETERAYVVANLSGTWVFEGTAYNVSLDPSGAPVYRFYDFKKGVHFYTASEAERANVVANLSSVYRYEGICFYLAP